MIGLSVLIQEPGEGRCEVPPNVVPPDSRFLHPEPNGALVTTREVLAEESAMIETALAGQGSSNESRSSGVIWKRQLANCSASSCLLFGQSDGGNLRLSEDNLGHSPGVGSRGVA